MIAFRNSGTTTLVEDCTVSKTVSTMEALTPNLVLIPELSQPVPTMTAYRIVLSPPAELP